MKGRTEDVSDKLPTRTWSKARATVGNTVGSAVQQTLSWHRYWLELHARDSPAFNSVYARTQFWWVHLRFHSHG